MNIKIITPLSIRFNDVDAMGHVNNAVFFTYFEEGRKNFVHSLFNIVNPEDYNFIIAHLESDFIKPVKLKDSINVETWVGEIGNKKFTFKYRIVNRKNNASVYAEGHSIQVFYDYTAKSSIPIPDKVRKELLLYTEKSL